MSLQAKLDQHRADKLKRLKNWRGTANSVSDWSEQGLSLLMKIALDCPEETHLLKDVLSAGPDLEFREERSGFTALHFAVQSKAQSVIRELLAAGSNPNSLDRSG
ncbi:MAG: hypothetical protein AAF718_09155 [Pseudomonadota bacterium]